jgi:hypothetical protein
MRHPAAALDHFRVARRISALWIGRSNETDKLTASFSNSLFFQ